MAIIFLLLILAFLPPAIHAESAMGKFFSTARSFEIRPMKKKPAWAGHPEQDLFRIAWLTDQHFVHAASVEINRISLNQLRDEIRPLAVIITGDNCGLQESLLPPVPFGEKNLPLRRQKYLKATLDKELNLPYFIIPGDNWPAAFNQVFGSDQYSFNLGGFHFIFFSADYQTSEEGCISFKDSSLKWLEEDIQQNHNRPCLYFSHEPIYPQVFVDAPRITALFKKYPQIVGALCGHLHLDLEFRRKHWTQWIGPSIGRSHRPGFKLLRFRKEAVVMESYEWNPRKQKFLPAPKWQKIDIPEKLQQELTSVPVTSAKPQNYRSLPPHARLEKKELKEKIPQLAAARMAFIIEFGFSSFFNK